MDESAQFFLDNGGLTLVATADHPYGRPCLDPVNMKKTLLGGVGVGTSPALIKFIEDHKLAQTKREARPSGYEGVSVTPIAPYESNWITEGDFGSFCFGKLKLVKAEVVPDAKPITAGASEPYIIPGTEARATRLTFRLDDVPGGTFLSDLTNQRTLLARGAMQPEDYGKDITVVATLPTKTENYSVKP